MPSRRDRARRTVLIWAGLVVATVTAVLVSGVGGGRGVEVGAAAAVVIGMAKVAVIGAEFMELRWAPRRLRALFLGWTTTLTVVFVVLILAGG